MVRPMDVGHLQSLTKCKQTNFHLSDDAVSTLNFVQCRYKHIANVNRLF